MIAMELRIERRGEEMFYNIMTYPECAVCIYSDSCDAEEGEAGKEYYLPPLDENGLCSKFNDGETFVLGGIRKAGEKCL